MDVSTLNFSRSKSEMDLITRRIIAKREGDNVSDRILQDYANPDSTNYKEMLEEIRKELNFTSLKYHRLDDLKKSLILNRASFALIAGTDRNKQEVTAVKKHNKDVLKATLFALITIFIMI